MIGILTQEHLYEKTISNMVECKSRGAYLMGLTTYGHYSIEDTADFTAYIPKMVLTFCNFAGGYSTAASWILCQCGQGSGCRQTEKSGKECNSRIISDIYISSDWFCIFRFDMKTGNTKPFFVYRKLFCDILMTKGSQN